MEENVVNYQCPNCSAGLKFDSKSQKMACEYCGKKYSLDELEKLAQENENVQEDQSGAHWEGFDPDVWETSSENGSVKVWSCPSCGAEVVTEKTTGAAVCPYCDTPLVMPDQFKDLYRPDYVIPFQKDKKAAKAALKAHYEGKPLLPKVFKSENHLEELKAMYVPFWMFDLNTAGRFRYEGTRRRVWEDSDYTYTETKYYNVVRSGRLDFKRIPVDGSKAIDNTMMEAIEPYDYKDLKAFDMSYLSGYIADKYDQEPDELTERVYERMEQSVRDSFESSAKGYETLTPKQEKIWITKKGDVKYGLFPVWFLNTKWKGKTYSFAMNGQTGHLIGDLPIGKDLVVEYWLKHHIPLTLILTVILTLLRLKGVF